MTLKQIESKQMHQNLVFETAKKIRALLDEARKEYGATEWEEDDKESEVIALVTEE